MQRRCSIAVILSIVVAVPIATLGGQSGTREFTTDFGIHCSSTLLPTGGNPFLSLDPGTMLRLEGEDDNQPVMVEITVLNQTRQVTFEAADGWMTVETRIIEEREWVSGELAQVSLNYFAACPVSGNVYNFGEEVSHYENGEIVSTQDTWLAGQDGAKPGLQVPGFYLLGSRYHQELAPGVSMDCAEHVAMGQTFQTPAGEFANCVMMLETTPLEPDEEVLKVYAPGVGLIADGLLHLTKYQK